MIDTLTNLPNFTKLQEDLKEFKHPKLFLLDIEDFKSVNIRYSDIGGDFLLTSFASALDDFAKMHDMTCYRVEADRFALIKNIPFELELLENIIGALNKFLALQKYHFEGNTLEPFVKIGISLDHFDSLNKAYKALELCKKEGHPFVTYSQFAMNLLEESEEEKFNYIKNAITEKKILPYYQPVVDINHKILFREALIRIEGKDGVQSPKFFLDIAHSKGIYATIIEEISERIGEIKEPKSINLSYHDFEDETLFEFLIKTFKDSQTIFELQNDAFFHEIHNLNKIQKLKENGILICIDNVSHPQDLEPLSAGLLDFVKVHGDIIRLLPLHGKEYALAKEILKTSLRLKAMPIATHVNSQSSFTNASEIGFEAFQGFLFGKPSPTF